MSADKKVKLEFLVDQTSLNVITRAFEQVAEAAARAASAMGGGGGGLLTGIAGSSMPGTGTGSAMNKAASGGTGAQDTRSQLTKYVMDNLDALKKIGEGNKDVARIVAEAMHNSFVSQTNDLKELNRQAEEYRQKLATLEEGKKRFASLPDSDPSKNPALAKIDANIADTKLSLAQVEVKKHGARASSNSSASTGGIPGDGPAAKDNEEAGSSSGGGGWWSKTKGFVARNWRAAAGAGMMAAATADYALDETLAGSRGFAQMGARRSSSVTPMFESIMGGDMKTLYAMQLMQRDSNASDDMLAQSSSFAANAEQVKGGIGQALAANPFTGWLAKPFGAQDKGGGTFGGFVGAQQETGKAESMMRQAQAQATALSPLTKHAIDRFGGDLGSRISIGRILGTGLSNDPKYGWQDSYGNLNANLIESGYDIGQYASSYASTMNAAGRRFAGKGGGAFAAMAAAAAGYGGYGELLNAGARSGSGQRFAQAAIGGNIDAAAGIQLGQAIIGNGYNPFGQTGGFGTLAAFQNGVNWTGGSGDFNKVMAVQQAIGLGTSLTTGGFDPWQKSQNLINAIQANPGLGIYGQDYLANGMQFNQMVDIAFGGGKMTKTGQAYGVTQDMVKEQLSSTMSSFMNRYYDDGKSPVGKYINSFFESGKDLRGWLKGMSGKEQRKAMDLVGAWFGDEANVGEEGGIALMEGLAGLGGKGKSKKGLGGGMGEVEGTAMKTMAANARMVATELESIATDLKNAYGDAPAAAGALSTFGGNLAAGVDTLVTKFAELGDAIDQITGKVLTPEQKAARDAQRAEAAKQRAIQESNKQYNRLTPHTKNTDPSKGPVTGIGVNALPPGMRGD